MSCWWTGYHAPENLYSDTHGDWEECSKFWALLAEGSWERMEHRVEKKICLSCGKSVKKNKYRKMRLG